MKYVLNVYGRGESCHDSLKSADAKDSYDRLQEYLAAEYPRDNFHFNRIDMDSTENLTDHDENLIEQLNDGDLKCPLITINDEIVTDGVMSTEQVVKWFEQRR